MKTELFELLMREGAALVSAASLRDLPEEVRSGFQVGISIAVNLNPEVVIGIVEGPTPEYHTDYNRVNSLLKSLGESASKFLVGHGFKALNLAVTDLGIDHQTLSTPLPHKTVATKAGLGWIGKNALLVTRPFGSAVRLTSVLTDADLPISSPVLRSYCGNCIACVEACPGKAPKGENWRIGYHRDEFFKPWSCRKESRHQSLTKTNILNSICGICIAVCPWTQKYLKKSRLSLPT